MEIKEQTPSEKKKSLTILLPAGRLSLEILNTVNELARKFHLDLYFSTQQNLRLLGIKEKDLDQIKSSLSEVNAEFKAPGKFPLPKICIGSVDCKRGMTDTMRLNQKILDHFKERTKVKPTIKIAVSGCPSGCGGALLADIGIVAMRAGFDIYAGGKGGSHPKVARRIVRNADEGMVISVIEQLVDFHDAKTGKKQRIFKLLSDADFPFPEEV